MTSEQCTRCDSGILPGQGSRPHSSGGKVHEHEFICIAAQAKVIEGLRAYRESCRKILTGYVEGVTTEDATPSKLLHDLCCIVGDRLVRADDLRSRLDPRPHAERANDAAVRICAEIQPLPKFGAICSILLSEFAAVAAGALPDGKPFEEQARTLLQYHGAVDDTNEPSGWDLGYTAQVLAAAASQGAKDAEVGLTKRCEELAAQYDKAASEALAVDCGVAEKAEYIRRASVYRVISAEARCAVYSARAEVIVGAARILLEQTDEWEGPGLEPEEPRPHNGHLASIERNKTVRAHMALSAAVADLPGSALAKQKREEAIVYALTQIANRDCDCLEFDPVECEGLVEKPEDRCPICYARHMLSNLPGSVLQRQEYMESLEDALRHISTVCRGSSDIQRKIIECDQTVMVALTGDKDSTLPPPHRDEQYVARLEKAANKVLAVHRDEGDGDDCQCPQCGTLRAALVTMTTEYKPDLTDDDHKRILRETMQELNERIEQLEGLLENARQFIPGNCVLAENIHVALAEKADPAKGPRQERGAGGT